jgi:hypothetical protein
MRLTKVGYTPEFEDEAPAGVKLTRVEGNPFEDATADMTPVTGSPGALQIAGSTVATAGQRYKKPGEDLARAVAPYARPVLEIGGALTGATVGGAVGAFGLNPASVAAAGALGGGLGYAGGRHMANALEEYAGLREPPTFKNALLQTAEDIPYGAAMEVTGQAAPYMIKGAAQFFGKGIKPLWGGISGTGKAAIDEAIQSGIKGGKTGFTDAMRGRIEGDEIVDLAKGALQTIKDKRGAAYTARLDEISKITKDIDDTPIKKELAMQMQKFNVKVNPDGTVDLSRTALGDAGNRDIKAIIDLISDWGSKPGDKTPAGLDVLKRKLADFYSDSSQARSFVASLKNTTHNTITKAVPEYKKMTKDYAEATNIIKDLESGLMLRKQGMSGRIVADQTLRRLTSAMKDNFALRKELVDVLSDQGGQDIGSLAAGYAMNSWKPHGIGGSAPGMAAIAGLSTLISPKFWPLLATASPRVSGEFLHGFGRAIGAFKKTAPVIQTGVKTGGILMRNALNDE